MEIKPNLITHFEKICSDFLKKVTKKIIKKKPKNNSDSQNG